MFSQTLNITCTITCIVKSFPEISIMERRHLTVAYLIFTLYGIVYTKPESHSESAKDTTDYKSKIKQSHGKSTKAEVHNYSKDHSIKIKTKKSKAQQKLELRKAKLKPAYESKFPHIDRPLIVRRSYQVSDAIEDSGDNAVPWYDNGEENAVQERQNFDPNSYQHPVGKNYSGLPHQHQSSLWKEYHEPPEGQKHLMENTHRETYLDEGVNEGSLEQSNLQIQQDGKGFFGAVSGTAVSAVNALGQTITNWAGENNLIGSIGTALKGVAKSFSGALKYVLFTQKNPVEGIIFTPSTVAYTTYDPTQELIIIIHGYTMAGYYDNPNDNLISSFKTKDAFIKAGFKSNIVLVDWTSLSSDATYIFSSSSTATVGEDIASFILSLSALRFLPYVSWTRIVGYSLGAHAAGIAGSKVYEKTGQKIGHIDGIDPAGPNFDSFQDQRFQLSPTDATSVQVIHCNIKFLGTSHNRGTVDFYPQGGNDLPGCDPQSIKLSGKSGLPLGMDEHMCNHERCIDVYNEALTIPFVGCKCNNYQSYAMGRCPCHLYDQPHLGYYCEPTAFGMYFLNVNLKSTYQMYPPNYETYFQYGGVTTSGTPIQPPSALPPQQLPGGPVRAPFQVSIGR